MGQIREKLYNLNLNISLFYIMPLIIRLPDSIRNLLLKLRTIIRFFFSDYRAYVNRPGLKEIAIRNLSETLNIERKIAKRKIFRLMHLEVIVEKNGFLFDKYDLSTLKNQFYIEGLDMLNRALEKKKGVIFATVHSGDPFLFTLLMSLKGYDIYGLFDGAIKIRPISGPLHRFAVFRDKKMTGKIGKLYTGKGTRRIFDVLSNNGIIAWMVDLAAQNKKREIVINFLGSRISVNNTVLSVAQKTGALIVPYVSIYNFSMEKHEVYIGRAVDTSSDTIQDIFNFFEPPIKRHPESWLGWYYFDMLKKAD